MTDLRSIIGLPWAVPADPPNSFDCWALVIHVRALMGKNTPSYEASYSNYEMDGDYFKAPPPEWYMLLTAEIGAVARFGAKHVGVILPDTRIIHSTRKMGVRVDRASLMDRFGKVTYWETSSA